MPSLRSRFVRLYLNYLKATTNWNAPVEKLRKAADEGARLTSFPQLIQTERTTIETIPAEWLIPPQAANRSAVLYLHGGGFATGSIVSHRAIAGRIAEAGNVRTLIIDYRLAPEHPFPAALEDSIFAYEWLVKNGYQKIILVADSAGGGLALSTVVSLREKQLPMPLAVVCMSPLVEVEGVGKSLKTNAKRDPWLKEEAKSIFRYYVDQNDPHNPLISPLYADYTNFPPMLIFVGGDEIMLSDSTRLAEKARAVGVDVRLKIWPGMWHVFPFFAPFVPESSRAIAEMGDFIKARLCSV